METIEKTKQLLHVHIPKTGGWTIQTLFIESGYGEQIHGHRFAINIKNILKNKFNDYFTFAHTRNPWDRLVSVYSFCKNGSEILPTHTPGGMRVPPEHVWFDKLNCKSFDDFVIKLDMISRNRGDVYMTPTDVTIPNDRHENNINYLTLNQYNWVYDEKGKPIVDFIGRMENFEEIIKTINEIGGTDLPVPPKRNSSSHLHYTRFYNDETKKIVGRLYEKDIDTFKYTFE